jgi:hypothetical protein
LHPYVNPVSAFGAYWGAASYFNQPGNITVTLGDGSSRSFTYSRSNGDGVLEWHGWEFSEPISTIQFTAGDYSNMAIDGLQATSAVHEPTTIVAGCLLLIPLGASACRAIRK